MRDITVEKKAEETLRLANAEMERALRLKDEFLANMSHELRTPLNAILGISESLEEQVIGPLNDRQQHYIRAISESGHHLLALINDILDLSKIEAGRMEINVQTVSIEPLVQSSSALGHGTGSEEKPECYFHNRQPGPKPGCGRTPAQAGAC